MPNAYNEAPTPKKACTVCGKKTEYECSHTDCPNRKVRSAAPPDFDASGWGRAFDPEDFDKE